MTATENDKKSPLPLPNKYKEFYPKNYSKKNPINIPQHPLEKDSASFYPKSRKNQNARKNSEISDDISEDDYSGLAFKSQTKKDKNNQTTKKKKNSRLSEDYSNNYKTKWKTEMCHYWEMYGTCKYGNTCAFAHGVEELNKRKMSSNYKTKPCKQFFEIGYCTYGKRCQFSHKIKEEKEIDKENQISYLKILKEFNDQNKEISHELIIRPRLKTFENITSCTLQESVNSRLKLYEDIINIKELYFPNGADEDTLIDFIYTGELYR